jgi:hypothetical protein
MLPLLALNHKNTDAFDANELLEKAKKFERRRASAGGGVEPPVPRPIPGPPPEAVQRANDRARRVEEDAKRAAAEEMRKMGASVFETDPNTTDDASSGPYTSESEDSEYSEFGAEDGAALNADEAFDDSQPGKDAVNAEDGAALNADEAFEDNQRGKDAVNKTAIDEYVTVDQLESVVVHMKEAYELVQSSIADAPEEEKTALHGVMTRLKADMGLIRGMIRAMLRDPSGKLIRSPRTVRDIARVDQEVQTIVNSVGSSNPRMVSERALASMNSILPIISMLVYMLALYYVPGLQVPYEAMGPEEIPVVYPPNLTGPLYYYKPPTVIEPEQPMPFVPNVTPMNHKHVRGIFHHAVHKIL